MFKRPKKSSAPKKKPNKKSSTPKKESGDEETEETIEETTKTESIEELTALKAELRALKNQQIDLMAIISEMKTKEALAEKPLTRDNIWLAMINGDYINEDQKRLQEYLKREAGEEKESADKLRNKIYRRRTVLTAIDMLLFLFKISV